jgi:hypothetical protein
MAKMGNIGQMMEMAQGMARQMEEKMSATLVEGQAGGGMVTVRMNGHKQVLNVLLAKEAVVDPVDVEMLQDLVVAACHDAWAKVDETLKKDLGQVLPGVPGGFPFGAI